MNTLLLISYLKKGEEAIAYRKSQTTAKGIRGMQAIIERS